MPVIQVGDWVQFTPTADDLKEGREAGVYRVEGVYPGARLLGGMTGYRIAREGQPNFPVFGWQIVLTEDEECP